MAGPPEGRELFVHPLAGAVIEVVAVRGYADATVAEILTRAGVPREEFDRLFSGFDDAVLRVFESYIDDLKRRLGSAYRSAPEWPDNLRAAAYEFVSWIEEHPFAHEFGMVQILQAGEMARLRREEVFTWCAGLIDAGREAAPDPSAVPRAAPLIAIGAVVEMATRHAAGELEADPRATVPELMYAAVLPYLGEELARAELTRIPPARRG